MVAQVIWLLALYGVGYNTGLVEGYVYFAFSPFLIWIIPHYITVLSKGQTMVIILFTSIPFHKKQEVQNSHNVGKSVWPSTQEVDLEP